MAVGGAVVVVQVAPNRLKEVEMYRPWYSYLVALITRGIVTPITSQWECMGGPTSTAIPLPPPPRPAPDHLPFRV